MRKTIIDNPSKGLSFLYNNVIGRIIIKPVVSNDFLNKFIGWLLSKKISCFLIKPFIKKNNINMDDYEKKEYKSFNDFFIRKIKSDKRTIRKEKNIFIAPCDSKLTIYKINQSSVFSVKNSKYDVLSLIKDKTIADEYKNGYTLIFRLSPEDYHRYYFVDDGNIINNYRIKGKFHTVNPIVYDKFKVFKENNRECTIIDTSNFGKITYVEVGALLVGKIHNHNVSKKIKKGQEKGYFMFGGSTVILLLKNNVVKFDSDLLKNSKNGYETVVKLGEKIGEKI